MAQLENPDTLAPETDKGDTTGPVTIGMAVAVQNKAPEPAKAAERVGARTAGGGAWKRASWRSATPTSPATPTWASRATATCS